MPLKRSLSAEKFAATTIHRPRSSFEQKIDSCKFQITDNKHKKCKMNIIDAHGNDEWLVSNDIEINLKI